MTDKIPDGYDKIDMSETVKKLHAQPPLDLNAHYIEQQGYRLIDKCCSRSISIPRGKMIIGEKGDYKIVDEIEPGV